MSELSHQHKVFIVRALAQYLTPTEVAKLVKEEFDGLIVSRQAVRYYNPEQSPELADEWRELFKTERERAIADVNDVGTAHKSVRLRELDALYRKAKSMNATGLAAQLLEQIAKEEGGAFTNKRELTGKDGGALSVEIVPIVTNYRDATSSLAPPDEEPKNEAPGVLQPPAKPARPRAKSAKKTTLKKPAPKAKPTPKAKPKK